MMGVAILDRTVQKTNVWLKDACAELEWTNSQRAYLALRAVLHALRDRLSAEEIAQLGAQLPIFIRGIYYEGWNPARTPVRDRKRKAFLAQVQAEFAHTRNPSVEPERVVRAILRVLCKHITGGEMTQIKGLFHQDVRILWPNEKQAQPSMEARVL
jgi:uncharacterized protein (DUF2267 family)